MRCCWLAWTSSPAEGLPMDSLQESRTPRTYNLPVQLTSFVGRDGERADLVAMLGTIRQVTLVGAPGVGKTRLALRVAEDLAGTFSGGAWLVELAPIAEPGLVSRAVAGALGVRGETAHPLSSTLAKSLKSR